MMFATAMKQSAHPRAMSGMGTRSGGSAGASG